MKKIDRRDALTTVLAGGIGGVSLGLANPTFASGKTCDQGQHELQEPQEKSGQTAQEETARDLDREAIMSAGFTDAEADCWKLIAQAAGKFFELPELHPHDREEVAVAIHVVQNKLLTRPTYRKYVEEAKRLRGE